jgi:hypothetical protein
VRPLSVFVIADKVRPESADAVRKPRQLGIEVAMMTGDTEDIARAVELLDDPNDPVGIEALFDETLLHIEADLSICSLLREQEVGLAAGEFHCQQVLTPRRRPGLFGIREKGQLHPVLSMNGPEQLSELIPGHAGCGG